MTLENWLTTWVDIRTPVLKPRTIEQYRDLIARFLTPIANTPLADLQPDAIAALLAGVVSARKTRTAELIFVLLKAALKEIRPDLMTRVPRPKHRQKTPQAWTNDEMAVYFAALVDHPQRLGLTLGLALGLRRGEICGLRWQDIDFDKCQVHICNQRQRLANGQIVDMNPKSESSIRTIPIPDSVMPLLRSRRQLAGYLCPISPSGLDAAHRKLVGRLGLPYIPLHGLRHSMATACIRNGGNMKSLQMLLGHADYSTTANKYTHPDFEMLQSALDCAASAWYTVLQ